MSMFQYMLCVIAEYGMGNEVSIYGDVHSYGILLLEMFTGKRPTNSIFQEGLNLHDFVKVALPERIIDIVDPILLWEIQEEETRMNDTRHEDRNGSPKIQECLILILGIGVACSTEFSRERMNISAVVVELQKIQQNILRTSTQRQRQRLQTTGKYCFVIGRYNLVMYPPTPHDLKDWECVQFLFYDTLFLYI